MAVELGLNNYTPLPPPDESSLARLQRRNRERTYLVLWVHDRSLSMQTGRMWMLPEVSFGAMTIFFWEGGGRDVFWMEG